MSCCPGTYLSITAPLLKIKSGTGKKNDYGTVDPMKLTFPQITGEDLIAIALLDLPGKLDNEIMAIPLMLSVVKGHNRKLYFARLLI